MIYLLCSISSTSKQKFKILFLLIADCHKSLILNCNASTSHATDPPLCHCHCHCAIIAVACIKLEDVVRTRGAPAAKKALGLGVVLVADHPMSMLIVVYIDLFSIPSYSAHSPVDVAYATGALAAERACGVLIYWSPHPTHQPS